jgi:hypothetical protein
MVDVLLRSGRQCCHGHLLHACPLLFHEWARSHPEAHRTFGAAPKTGGLRGSGFRKRSWQKQWPPVVPLYQRESTATKARKARHEKTKRDQACLILEPTCPNKMTPTRHRKYRRYRCPAKFLRVRTPLLRAPDRFPNARTGESLCPRGKRP